MGQFKSKSNLIKKYLMLYCLFLAIKRNLANSDEVNLRTDLDCGSLCSCELVSTNYPKEFKVQCNGTNIERAVATDALFKGQNAPDWDHQVYVVMQNFSELIIKEDFLSKWLAYKSCSLDLWYNTVAHFPSVAPPRANNTVLMFYFAGIGLAYTRVPHLPSELFKDRDNVQITASHSSIGELDFGDIQSSAKGFSQLSVTSSQIGLMRSSEPFELVASGYIFQISDSHIGIIDSGGLSFNDTNYGPEARITNTNIGLLKKGSIKVGKSAFLKISNSSIAHVEKLAVDLQPESNFEITNSYLGLFEESLNSVICTQNTKITLNKIFPLTDFEGCNAAVRENSTGCHGDDLAGPSDYIHNSCAGTNQLLRAQIENAPNTALGKRAEPLDNDQISNKHIKLPLGLLYSFIAVSGTLLLMVFVLAALLICRKKPSRSKEEYTASSHPFLDSSTDHVYFSSNSHLGQSVII